MGTRLRGRVENACDVERTFRVRQMEGMFDVPPSEKSRQVWEADVTLPDEWNVGLIVGPSGSGKSTLARAWWPGQADARYDWPGDRSILDGFPESMGIRDVTGLLSSVGFSSPPSWLRPFRALSNGEQFRVHCARVLAEQPDPAVIDEFTSVVDRDVARVASAAVAKAVRRRGSRLVAVTCHYDVAEWLEPDWVFQPHTGRFEDTRTPDGRRSLRRPPVELEVRRVHHSAWRLFRAHHYLSADLSVSAYCFVALLNDRPAAFCAVLSNPHPRRPFWREHRTVCLPEWQGVGIGNALSEYVASLFAATGKPYRDTVSHPGHVRHRLRSPLWRCVRHAELMKRPKYAGIAGTLKTAATTRMTYTFEYAGPARPGEARGFGLPCSGATITPRSTGSGSPTSRSTTPAPRASRRPSSPPPGSSPASRSTS